MTGRKYVELGVVVLMVSLAIGGFFWLGRLWAMKGITDKNKDVVEVPVVTPVFNSVTVDEWPKYMTFEEERKTWVFSYVYSGESNFGVPVQLPDGTVVGTAEIALVGKYLDASGQKRKVLAVAPDYVVLPNGKNMFGELLKEEKLKNTREEIAKLYKPGMILTLNWFTDDEADLRERLKQNLNARPYPQRARDFLDKYYAAWANEWEAFKISGDPSIKLLIGAATGGTGGKRLSPAKL